jgi:hypothetical protein
LDLCTQPVWTSRNVEAPGGDNRSAITDIRYDPETLPTTEAKKTRVRGVRAPPADMRWRMRPQTELP